MFLRIMTLMLIYFYYLENYAIICIEMMTLIHYNLAGVFWYKSVLGTTILGMFQAILYISSEHNVRRNNKKGSFQPF